MRPKTVEGTGFGSLACAPLESYLRSQPELNDSSLPDFDILEWEVLLDSSDVDEGHWAILATQIKDNYDDYCGFVVLHGTDALAYTATALSFMLENLGKPVVVTGSMLPMSHIHTDGRRNVTVSLLIAGFSEVSEVIVVFGSRILRGCRASKRECLTMDAFDSPNVPHLGRVGIDVTINNSLLLSRPVQPLTIFTDLKPSSVVALVITPGFSPFLIRHLAARESRPLGIVLELFGTGTAPTGHPKFLEAIQFAIASGVTIVAVTQCSKGTCSLRTYENGERLHEIGVIEGKDLTLEAAVVKLAYLFGKQYTGADLVRYMELDLRGELTEKVSKITGQATLTPLAKQISLSSGDSAATTTSNESEMSRETHTRRELHPRRSVSHGSKLQATQWNRFSRSKPRINQHAEI